MAKFEPLKILHSNMKKDRSNLDYIFEDRCYDKKYYRMIEDFFI